MFFNRKDQSNFAGIDKDEESPIPKTADEQNSKYVPNIKKTPEDLKKLCLLLEDQRFIKESKFNLT